MAVALLVLFTHVFIHTVQAQGQDARPRVGLVLGGGSARGLSHVGVLDWLEEHRIPVDYVAGTSMGGLIGGVYATGRSPEEIGEILREADWDLLFLGDVPYPLKPFRRKEDRVQYPFRLEFGLRGGINLPSGIDPGHQVGLFLSRLAFRHSTVTDFDELPIPFRCVAVDMERGESVVLGSGSLGHALRATMSIPGVFAPVEIDGKLLSDGGILNNVPTDVVRDMGADVIIAVNVGAGLVDRSKLRSPLALVSQSVTVMMLDNTRRALELADVLIAPELDDVGSTDWRRLEELAQRGYDATAAKADQLEPFAIDEAAWEQHLAERRRRRRDERLQPSFVAVEGVSALERESLELQLSDHLDAPLDTVQLEEDLTVIAGTGRYESLRYRASRSREQDGLLVDVTPKTHGPPFVNFAGEVGNQEGDIDFNFGARITAYDVLAADAETRLDVLIGVRNGIEGEYYLPLGEAGWFAAPHATYLSESRNSFQDGDLVATFGTRRTSVGADLGFAIGPASELRAGYDIGHLDTSVDVGDPSLLDADGREQVVRLRWRYDGSDRWIVPRRGVIVESLLRWYLETADGQGTMPQAEARSSIIRPVRADDRLTATLRGGTSFDNDPSAVHEFGLGGPFRLGAFGVDEFRGNHFLYLSLGYLKSLGQLPDIVGGPIFLAGWAESGSAFDRIDNARVHSNVSSGFIMETFLGPVTFAGSIGDGGSSALYFSIGGRIIR